MLSFKRFLSGVLVFLMTWSLLPVQFAHGQFADTSVALTLLGRNVTENEPQHTDEPMYVQVGDELDFFMMIENSGEVELSNAQALIEFRDDQDQVIPLTNAGITITDTNIKATAMDTMQDFFVDMSLPITLPSINPNSYVYLRQYSLRIEPTITTPQIRHILTVNQGNANEKTEELPIYIDVKPHVQSTTFTKANLIGNGVDTTVLRAQVYDGNGCADIASVEANFSQVFPNNTVPNQLSFVSCDLVNGRNVATYELPNIQYQGDPREFEITVKATDTQGNVSDPQDQIFSSGDTPSSRLTIIQDQSPTITVTGTTTTLGTASEPLQIDGVNATQAQITWSADKPVHYYIRKSQDEFGEELLCNDVDDLSMRTNLGFDPLRNLDNRSLTQDPRTRIPALTPITTTIDFTELPQLGRWYIRLCGVSEENGEIFQGGNTVRIDKVASSGLLLFDLYDTAITTVPGETMDITWQTTMAEGTYTFIVNGQDLSTISLPANTVNAYGTYPGRAVTTRLDGSLFNLGNNDIQLQFTDSLGNTIGRGLTVPKVSAPDPLTGVSILPDVDFNNGFDIRDVRVQWNAYPNTNSDFHSYAVYLLQDGVAFQDGVHQPIAYVNSREETPGSGIQTFISPLGQASYRSTDSEGHTLSTIHTYRAYVQVQNQALQRSLATPSLNTMTYTVDGRPQVLSARLTSTGTENTPGTIVLTSSMPLDENAVIDPAGFTGTFTNPANFSISGNTLSFTIDGLANQATNQTGVISIAENSFFAENNNGNLAIGNLTLQDGIAPRLQLLRPGAGSFINQDLVLEYTFSETVDPSTVKVTIEQIGGNTDSYAPHVVVIDDFSAANTNHIKVLNTQDLSANGDSITTDALVSGATYRITMTARDTAGNEGTVVSQSFQVDASGPITPAVPQPVNGNGYTSSATPTFTWLPAVDNTGGAGISRYTLEIFAQGANTPYTSVTDIIGTSITLPLAKQLPAPGVYEFRVIAVDTLGNSTPSERLAFTFVTAGPEVQNSTLLNLTKAFLNGTPVPFKPNTVALFKNGDQFQLQGTIIAGPVGIDQNNITADLSVLNSTLGTTPADTFDGTTASFTGTVSKPDGVYTIQIQATDNTQLNGQGAQLQFEIDSTDPEIDADALTVALNPSNNQRVFRTGQNMNIQWDISKIREANYAANPIDLELLASDNTVITTIASNISNSGNYVWPVPAGINQGDLRIRMTVEDILGHSTEQIFSFTPALVIDNTPPSQFPIIITPNASGIVLQGDDILTINWGGTYSDALSPRSDYFELAYSLNGGASWELITTVTTPNGNYDWTVPTGVTSSNALIRILATDVAGNQVSDTSDNPFRIDSTAPYILSALTHDIDANGQIDAIELLYSEPIADNSITASNYDVAGYTGEQFILGAGDQANDGTIFIAFNESGALDTHITPTITYIQGSTTDLTTTLAGNQILVSTDMAGPVARLAELQDLDNNGYVDQILVTFSENLADTTDLTPWTFSNLPAGGTVTALSIQGNTAVFTVQENTTLPPDTGTGTFQITLLGGSTPQDLAGVPAVDATLQGNFIVDTLPPAFTASAVDITTTALGPVPGRILVQFSEPVTNTTQTSEWTVPGYTVASIDATPDGQGFITELILELAEDFSSTDAFPTTSFSGTTTMDSNNNALPTATVATADLVGPKLVSIVTQDSTGNGETDRAVVTFSETITADTTNIQANGVSNFAATSTLNNQVTLDLAAPVQGTDEGLVDITWNLGALQDSQGNTSVALASGEYTEIDLAGPALIGARYLTATNRIILTFSEPVNDTVFAASSVSNIITLANGGTVVNSTFDLAADPANNNQVIVQLGGADATPIINTTTVALRQAGVVEDLRTPANLSTGTTAVTLLGSLIISEVNWGEAGEEWVEIQNLDDTPLTITPANQLSLYKTNSKIATIDTGTIPAGGFLIVARQPVTANALLDSAFTEGVNYITDVNLDLAPVNGLQLALYASPINVGVPLDRVDDGLDNAYFAGLQSTGGTAASMERRTPVASGQLITSWQTSSSFTGNFDTPVVTRRATPGEANILDTMGPVINDGSNGNPESRLPRPNTLTPSQFPTISASYTETPGSAVDTTNIQLSINGADVTANAVITDTEISYTPAVALPFGQNQVVLTVHDIAGNPSTTSWDFWVDNYSVQITNTPVMFVLGTPGAATNNPTQRTVVAVNTYGAGVTLDGVLEQLLDSGSAQISDYVGAPEQGFGYEAQTIVQDASLPAPDVLTLPFTNTFTPFGTLSPNQLTFANATVAPQPLGNLQTYYFVLQYRLAVPANQPADVYTTSIQFVPRADF